MARVSAVSFGGNPPSSARETAFWLLECGLWPVLVRPGMKAPVDRGWGLKLPSRDQLEAGFRRLPEAGVALLLGPQSGVVDLEVDDPLEAETVLSRLFPDGVPPTVEWESPRGTHRLFRWHPLMTGVPSVITFADGALELRVGGEGKQVMSICPPTAGEEDGVPRRWRNVGTISPLPDGMMRCLRQKAVRPKRLSLRASQGPPSRALEREAARVRAAPVGTRNATLNRAAFVVGLHVGRGGLDRPEAESLLQEAAEACGLSMAEAASTIRRGISAGISRASSA